MSACMHESVLLLSRLCACRTCVLTHLTPKLAALGARSGPHSAFQCWLAVFRSWNLSPRVMPSSALELFALCPYEAEASHEVSSPTAKGSLTELACATRGYQAGCLQPCWSGNHWSYGSHWRMSELAQGLVYVSRVLGIQLAS